MKEFFQDLDGKYSMMRLVVFLAALCAMGLIVAGIVGFIREYANSLAMVAAGSGLFSLSEVLKLVQKRME